MRKVFVIVLFGVFISFIVRAGEDKFVNPIFYQAMEGVGTRPDLIKISPSEIYIQNYYGYSLTAKCEMLENVVDTVILKCLYMPRDKDDDNVLIMVDYDEEPTYWTHKFYIWPKEEQTSELGIYVRKYNYYKDEKKWTSYENLIIYYSEENYMKRENLTVTPHTKE